jgi:ABC-type uncharacterized transport system permease subunit
MKTTELPRWATGFVLPILNLLSALLVAALVIHLLGESPLESMTILINSAIVNPEGLAYTLFYASTFIFTGLAVSIAMQAGLFNIGAEGQMYVGGLGLTWPCWPSTPPAGLAADPGRRCWAPPCSARCGPSCPATCRPNAAATWWSRPSCSTSSPPA